MSFEAADIRDLPWGRQGTPFTGCDRRATNPQIFFYENLMQEHKDS